MPPWIWIWAWAALMAYIAFCAVYLVLERRSPQSTLAWLFAMALFPLLGLLAFIVLGQRIARRRRLRSRALEAVVAKVDAWTRPPADALAADPGCAALVRLSERGGILALPSRLRTARTRMFFDGASAYDAILAAVAGARDHVHVEVYIFEPDGTGARFRDALAERARAGVEVRLLVDGIGCPAGDDFFAPLRAAGGRVATFNRPAGPRWRPRLSNFRTHRKIVVVDGRAGFTGGMNISDCHDARASGSLAWRDTHVGLEGAAVAGLQMVFLQNWFFATGAAPLEERFFAPAAASPEGAVPVQIVASGPDETFEAIHRLHFAAIAGAGRRVLLTSAYFVPDEPLLAALITAACSGVDVRVLVPETGDVPLVAAAARTYYPELLRAGVRIFEYRAPVLHAKTLVVDDRLAWIGTANFDNRSMRLNFEVGAAIYDAAAADALAAAFESDAARAREVTEGALARVPFHRRLLEAVARLLAPQL